MSQEFLTIRKDALKNILQHQEKYNILELSLAFKCLEYRKHMKKYKHQANQLLALFKSYNYRVNEELAELGVDLDSINKGLQKENGD